MPGQISDKLKDALGLRKNELPLHIYRMRLLGYPPAWLEEAKIQHSGLALYDSKGKRVLEEDEDDGEVDTPKHKYDVQRLHDFPGFNVATDFEIFEVSLIFRFWKIKIFTQQNFYNFSRARPIENSRKCPIEIPKKFLSNR